MKELFIRSKFILSNLTFFFVAKLSVFIVPLLLAKSLDNIDYGQFEVFLSYSMLLTNILLFGAGNIIAFDIVNKQKINLINEAIFHSLIASLLCLIVSIFLLKQNYIFQMASLIVAQSSLSSYIKAKGSGAKASIVEASLYLVLLVVYVISIYSGFKGGGIGEYSYYFILLSLIYCGFLLKILTCSKISYLSFLKRGFPIMIAGSLAVLFLNSPRLLLNLLSGPADVSTFSVFFRWSAIALIAYQFLNVVFFRKIYRSSYAELNIIFTKIILFSTSVGALVIFGISQFGWLIDDLIEVPDSQISLQIIFLLIISFWISSTLLENLCYRDKMSKIPLFGYAISILFLWIFSFILKGSFENELLFILFLWFFCYCFLILFYLFRLKSLYGKYHFGLFTFVFFILVSIGLCCFMSIIL